MLHDSYFPNDPLFRVERDPDACSPNPEKAIWRFQHIGVSPILPIDSTLPKEPGKAIVKHQLGPKGHYSVTESAFAVVYFGGFPTHTAMQMCRHRGFGLQVQSFRYTGDYLLQALDDSSLLRHFFYTKPPGQYRSREGIFTVTEAQVDRFYKFSHQSLVTYKQYLDEGWPEEDAREVLTCTRQNFAMAGTVRDFMHCLDQRTLQDTQVEARVAGWRCLTTLEEWCPTVFEWYRNNRAGRNLLAP
jgi:thymidylate synthase (FAD)